MSHLDDPFTPPAVPEASPGEAVTGPSSRATTRRRTRAARSGVQEELARRRAERAETGQDAEVSDDGPPQDRGVPRLIDYPADGIPDVVEDEGPLADAARALAKGTGPIAVDAERASGYRYGQRAYLVQLRRAGASTILIDPVACPDLRPLAPAVADVEWVLHAATQDLPCLAELGLAPSALFDTELGARLAGQPRVALAAVLEHYLGVTLAKEHSAVDWSTRPLPEPWLRYAALDVEVLLDLRDAVEADLAAQGKLDWAREEFAALTRFTGPPRKPDPWRRMSGLHRVRGRRALALARELWYARDEVARTRDISPGRVIPDAALLEIAQATPRTLGAVGTATTNRAGRRYASTWLAAVTAGLAVSEDELPPTGLPSDGPPPQRAWADRDPVAAARLGAVRDKLGVFSRDRAIPVENVLSPDTLRRLLWAPPPPTEEAIRAALAERGARAWQIEIAAPIVLDALQAHR